VAIEITHGLLKKSKLHQQSLTVFGVAQSQHPEAGVQQLQHRVGPDVAGGPGDQHGLVAELVDCHFVGV
jgi:hypothetical protein